MFHALSYEYNMSGYILSPEHTAHLSDLPILQIATLAPDPCVFCLVCTRVI
jgi:hypothetical protein